MNTRKRINKLLNELRYADSFDGVRLSAQILKEVEKLTNEEDDSKSLRIENSTKWKHPWKTERPKGGFEPIPGYQRPCCHPEHKPPMHLWIPPGQQYRHVCPACGMVVIIRGSDIICCV